MAIKITRDQYQNKFGQPPVLGDVATPVTNSMAQVPRQSFGQDTMSDIRQTGSEIGQGFTNTFGQQGTVNTALEASRNGEQGIFRGFGQAVGAAAGGVSGMIGSSLKGIGKSVLPQAGEDFIKQTIQGSIQRDAERGVGFSSPTIQNFISKYQNLDEKKKRDIAGLMGMSSLSLDLAFVPGIKSVATSAVKTGLKGTETITRGVGTALEQGAIKARPIASKVMGSIGERGAEVAPEATEMAVKTPAKMLESQKSAYSLSKPQMLEKIQSGVRNLRTKLTNEYQVGEKQIIEKNSLKRIGLNEKEQTSLKKLSDKYGIELPQNLNSLSVKETFDLNSQLGELKNYSDIAQTAEGKPVRDIYDLVRGKVKEFEGTDEFLKNYSTKKTLLDSVDGLFNAYKTKDPKKVAAAFRNMNNLFKEDKFKYAEAIEQLTKETGGNLMNELKAMQLRSILPKEVGTKFNWSDIFRLTFFPLTSPRLIGFESKAIGRALNAAQNVGDFLRKLKITNKTK